MSAKSARHSSPNAAPCGSCEMSIATSARLTFERKLARIDCRCGPMPSSRNTLIARSLLLTCSCRSRSRVSSSRRSSSSFATSDAFFASSASSCRICALRRCVVSLIGSPAAAATPPFAAGLLCLVARFPEDLLLNGTLPLPPPPQLSERPLAHAAAAARVRRPRAPVASLILALPLGSSRLLASTFRDACSDDDEFGPCGRDENDAGPQGLPSQHGPCELCLEINCSLRGLGAFVWSSVLRLLLVWRLCCSCSPTGRAASRGML
mmetsp:Transcript_29932/g.88612  ORF Transcript_29932/g.88612 Transcript_29932/m.88612 type:complete len:265 (-) Transcript_29932:665-1459(-)